MEIKNNLHNIDPYNKTKIKSPSNKTANRGNAIAPVAITGDRVSVSPEARLQAEAFTAAMSAPDVRLDKVAALKAKVESGEYTPDSKAIAARLLEQEPGVFRS